jgi:hypothetical protein
MFNMRCKPEILTNSFQGADLQSWKQHLSSKRLGEPFVEGSPMGIWVLSQLVYLERAVGKPDPQIRTVAARR